MTYFRAYYDYVCRSEAIRLEAYDRGFQLRQGKFFFNPQTQMYDAEIAERWQREQTRHAWKVIGLEDVFDGKKYRRDATLATIVYFLTHLRKVHKSGTLIATGVSNI